MSKKIKEFHNKDWNKRKKIICTNCDKEGHVHRNCPEPITSYGIIAVKTTDILIGSRTLKYFMVQRRCTMGYIDFIRGKYINIHYLKICLDEMTLEEKELIKHSSFETLWNNLWMNHNSKIYINSFLNAKEKFEKLNIHKLLDSTSNIWTETEYGFPKGRKNVNEGNFQCANREFKEESGFKTHDYHIRHDFGTFEELFTGTNGILYKHVYYIAVVSDDVALPVIDFNNISQSGEIKKLGWFTFEEANHLIRSYDHAKKNILLQVHNILILQSLS